MNLLYSFLENNQYTTHRFVIPDDLFPTSQLKNSEQSSQITTVKTESFKNIFEIYSPKIQSLLSDKNWQTTLKNKSLALLFCDKVGQLLNKLHPNSEYIKKWGYGSATFSSMEMMRYLEGIKEDKRIVPETKKLIEQWIKEEKKYLPLAVIMDGWRESTPGLLDFVRQGNAPSKVFSCSIKEEEIEIVSRYISESIEALEDGESFKIPGGSFLHETRLIIQKMPEQEFLVCYFNTAGQDGKFDMRAAQPTGVLISVDNNALLKDSNYWKEFIKYKFSTDPINWQSKHLDKLGRKSLVEREFQKSLQESDSCSFQSVLADIKYSFFKGFPFTKDLEQYNICRALMGSMALDSERNETDEHLFKIFESIEHVTHRILDWLECIKDEEKFKKLKSAYLASIVALDPSTCEADLKKNIEVYVGDSSPLMSLLTLEGKLMAIAKDITYREFETVIKENFTSDLMTFQPCLKHSLFYKNSKEILKTSLEEEKSVKGQFLKIARASLVNYTPRNWRPYLYATNFNENSAPKFLEELAILEDKNELINEIEELLTLGFISPGDIIQLIHSCYMKNQIEKGRLLIQKNMHLFKKSDVEMYDLLLNNLPKLVQNMNPRSNFFGNITSWSVLIKELIAKKDCENLKKIFVEILLADKNDFGYLRELFIGESLIFLAKESPKDGEEVFKKYLSLLEDSNFAKQISSLFLIMNLKEVNFYASLFDPKIHAEKLRKCHVVTFLQSNFFSENKTIIRNDPAKNGVN